MYLFGYGSLIWKADFPFEERYPGYIHGYVRRFWQGSTDHRGVVGKPGRVVTLLPWHEWRSIVSQCDPTMEDPISLDSLNQNSEEHSCITWGVVYRIAEEKAELVRAHLDYREKGGYAVHSVTVHLASGGSLENVLVYIGSVENPNYLGPASLDAIAHQIATSIGPSGPNLDYLLHLCDAVRDLHQGRIEQGEYIPVLENTLESTLDPHLDALEERVRQYKIKQVL